MGADSPPARTVNLRPFQIDLLARVEAEFAAGARSVLMQASTGSGKTHLASHWLSTRPGRGAFLCHRDFLISQTSRRLQAAGVYTGFVQAGRPSEPLFAKVQVCSVQTITSRGNAPPAEFVVVDEARMCRAKTIQAIIDTYPKAQILGLDATPQRSDGKAMGAVFERLVCGPQNRALINEGFIVPWQVVCPPLPLDKGLSMDPVEAYNRFTPGTIAVVLAQGVAHAHDLVTRFQHAEMIIGETQRQVREDIVARVYAGETKVIVSVDVLVDGFDLPKLETIIIARSVGVTGEFLQICGRGGRIYPGKTHCTVLDLKGSALIHGLPDEDRVWSLTGKPVKRIEDFTKIQRCRECMAVYRPAAACPRCGARCVTAPQLLPRVLTKSENLARLDHLPQHERDRRYLDALVRVAMTRLNKGLMHADAWALRQFRKKFSREPATRQAPAADFVL